MVNGTIRFHLDRDKFYSYCLTTPNLSPTNAFNPYCLFEFILILMPKRAKFALFEVSDPFCLYIVDLKTYWVNDNSIIQLSLLY